METNTDKEDLTMLIALGIILLVNLLSS